MRTEIKDLKDLTDSREILESKPHPFVLIFLTILILLLGSLLVWTYYGSIDSVAKAIGVVKPNEKISVIQSPVVGKLEAVYFSEGQEVKEGEILFSLDQEEIEAELVNRRASLNKTEEEIEHLNKFKESVEAGENLFSAEEKAERAYFELANQYFISYKNLKTDLQRSEHELTGLEKEMKHSLQTMEESMKENKRNTEQLEKEYEVEKEKIQEEIFHLKKELDNEEALLSSVRSKEDLLPDDAGKRKTFFASYYGQLTRLEQVAEEYKSSYEDTRNADQELLYEGQLKEEKQRYETVKQEIEQLQNETLLSVETNLEQLESRLKQAETQVDVLERTVNFTTNNSSLLLEKEHLSERQNEVLSQKSLQQEANSLVVRKLKADQIVQINSQLDSLENEKKQLLEVIAQLEYNLDKHHIVAPYDGTINKTAEYTVGQFVQAGENIVSVIPEQETTFKMEILVPDHEIGKIELGSEVKFHFNAYPSQNYGHLTGEITSVSSNSVIQEGYRFYIVEASINEKKLVNRQGGEGEIRIGMTAESFVITDNKKILHFILEKVNLRN